MPSRWRPSTLRWCRRDWSTAAATAVSASRIFFWGNWSAARSRQGLKLYISGCEYARDLTAPPAAMLDGAVFLRRDALRRWLWDKIEIWGVRKSDGALKSALECYGFPVDAMQALETMSEQEAETLILHELGEAMAEPLLGPAWRELIASFTGRRAEILARAVRDNLADCLSTLPRLIERDAAGSIHFYFANFEGMREKLFPLLAQAYRSWRETGSAAALRDAAEAGSAHWRETALAFAARASGRSRRRRGRPSPPGSRRPVRSRSDRSVAGLAYQ